MKKPPPVRLFCLPLLFVAIATVGPPPTIITGVVPSTADTSSQIIATGPADVSSPMMKSVTDVPRHYSVSFVVSEVNTGIVIVANEQFAVSPQTVPADTLCLREHDPTPIKGRNTIVSAHNYVQAVAGFKEVPAPELV